MWGVHGVVCVYGVCECVEHVEYVDGMERSGLEWSGQGGAVG